MNKMQELKRWLKRSLKKKVSINDRTVISFLMLGFIGFGVIVDAAWSNQPVQFDGTTNQKKMTVLVSAQQITGRGSVIFADADKIVNDDGIGNKKNPLTNSVIIGFGDSGARGQSMEIDVKKEPDTVRNGIVAIGAVKVSYNPFGAGDGLGKGSQAVAIGNDVASTSQAVAIGNNTYALGSSSIAIGNDDNKEYTDKISEYDYNNYLKQLYDKIDSGRVAYGTGSAANAVFSPNVAGGQGSISIGSRTLAYKNGSTAIGTLAFALGKGATALGTQSRAEGEGAIAIGNKAINFADRALAIGNDTQILKEGGTAVGLRAKSGGEGSIAIGTDVYANTKMTINSDIIQFLAHNRGVGLDKLDEVEEKISGNSSIVTNNQRFHDVDGIVTQEGKNAIAIGTKTIASGDNAVSLGRGAFGLKKNSFAIGSYSFSDNENALAIGTSARALGKNSITLGVGSATENNSENSTVVGNNSAVISKNSSLLGSNSWIQAEGSLVFGNGTNIKHISEDGITSKNNIAVGNNILIGSGVQNSMAYGSGIKIGEETKNNNIENATALGVEARIKRVWKSTTEIADKLTSDEVIEKSSDKTFMHTGNNTMALGNNSVASLENSVALGYKSVTDYTYRDLLHPGWTAKGSLAIPTTGQTGVISVGSKGKERRIVNVASGWLDTDAVNVVQLRTLEEKVDSRVDNIESGMHYLSVNKLGQDTDGLKGSQSVTELIERRKNYDMYIRYKIQSLQLTAREKWLGEKFDPTSKRAIDDKVREIENADTSNYIKNAAQGLRNITISELAATDKPADKYNELVTKIETVKDQITTPEAYRNLIGGEDIEELKKVTNYSNEGAKGKDSLAIGFRALAGVDATNSISMGYRTNVTGAYSVAIGDKAEAKANNTVALGAGAKANVENSVAIGKGTEAKASTENSYATNRTFTDTGKVVAFGTRRLTGVEDGANDDEAVTVRQLKATLPTIIAQYLPGGVNNFPKLEPGATITIKGGDFNTHTTDSEEFYSGNNLATHINGNGKTPEIMIGLKKIPTFKSLKLNNENSGAQSLSLTVDDSGNLSVGNKKITGLADGTVSNTSTDAVTGKQLNTVKTTADTAKSTADTVAGKITTLEGKKLGFTGDSGSKVEKKLGEDIAIKGDDSSITTKAGDNAITISVKDGGITTTKLGEKAVTTAKIADKAVGSTQLGDSAVTTDKIANKNITEGKLEDSLLSKINAGNTVASNTITLAGDNGAGSTPTKTTAISLNKSGGIEFTVSGKDGLKTTASGSKVEVGMTEDLKNKIAKLDNLAENAGTTYATKTDLNGKANIALDNINTSGINKIKDTAKEAVTVTGTGNISVSSSTDNTTHKTTYTVTLDDDTKGKIGKIATGAIAASNAGTVTGGTVHSYLTTNYSTTTQVESKISAAKTTVANAANSPITVTKDESNTTANSYTVDVTKSNVTGTGIKVTNGTGKVLGTGNLTLEIEDKAITETKLSDDLKNKIAAIENKASVLNLSNGKSGADEKTGSVDLNTTKLVVAGTNGVSVDVANNKFTVSLDADTKAKIDNAGKKSDGRDGKDATDGTAGSNGSHGLTANDGLNGKDLTDKVNALRNGEAGTVIFTNANGDRVLKANNGKYYKESELNTDGTPKDGFVNNGLDNPELRLVNASGSTTTVTTLNNLANGLMNITRETGKAITAENAKTAIEALLIQTTGLDKAVNVGDLQALAQAGLNFSGNSGDAVHRALGKTLEIKGKSDATYTDDDYTTENVATRTTTNGLEIGFKKSPTFKKVTADEVETGKAKIKDEITFDKGDGKTTTIVAGDGKGSLLINGKKVATSDSAPVLYTDDQGNIVEKGLDGKIYKAEDLKDKRYDVTTNKYYGEDQFVNGKLKENPTVATLVEVPANKVRHALASLNDGSVTSAKVLDKVADGKIGENSKEAINGSQIKTVLDKMGVELDTNGNIKAPEITPIKDSKDTAQTAPTTIVKGLNDVISTLNSGITFGGDNEADKSKQLLGSTLEVKSGDITTGTDANAVKYVGTNIKTKYAKDASGNGVITVAIAENPKFETVETKGITLADKTDATKKASIVYDKEKVTINGKEVVTKEALDTVTSNNFKLDGDTGSTANQALNKAGGLSFGIKGSDTIETKASGSDVTIKLKDAYKSKLDNLDANANDKYATKDLDNMTDNAKAKVKDLAVEAVTVTAGTGIQVTETAGTNSKSYEVKLDDSTQAKLNNISAKSDGRDGKEGKDGQDSNATHGLTGKDGLNGKDLTDKVNALRNGEAGTVIFTNEAGERLIKGNDGKYYKPDQLDDKGNVKADAQGKGVENPELRLVNANGETTKATTLNNLASALSNRDADTAITAEKAKGVVETLLTKTNGLDKAVNLADLQAIAQAGLDFSGNTGVATLHRALGTKLQIVGEGTPATDFVGASDNINVKAIEDATDKISKLEIQLAKALKNIESIQNGDTKITLDKDKGVAINGKDGGTVVVKGKDGKDGVSIKGGDGTNAPTIAFNKTDDSKGTGTITGLKDPELNDDGTPKDPTAATTVNYVTNKIEGAKTEITNKITNIVDGGMKYTGNDNVEVTVKLNKGLNIKGEGTYDGKDSASGNIAVIGNKDTSTLEIKLNKNLNNIETVSNGKSKITLGENGISISGKDGKDAVAINGTDGTNGASIVVKGKDGKDGISIKGGNGTNAPTIAFNKTDDNKGTGTITGLKDPELNNDGTPKDPTAATTVNYVNNYVTNKINSVTEKMDKGLNFVGNDGDKVNAKLDGTVSITGEGTVPTGTNTAANNIKVEKDTTTGKTGLVVKLADKLTGMTSFETKEEGGKKVTINKEGITFNKDADGKGTGVITGLKDSTDATSAVTYGTYNTFKTEVNNKLDKVSTIKYVGDNKVENTVAPDTGFKFKGDGNIVTEGKKDGEVTFNLSKNLDLGTNKALGTIRGLKTIENDLTSVATVDYVENKLLSTNKIAKKALSGVANAVAMANLPQFNSIGSGHAIVAAYGYYEGSNALALGVNGTNKKKTVIYRASGSLNTNGQVALGIGVGYQFANEQSEEIKDTISSNKSLKKEIAILKDKDAENRNIIDNLKDEMKKKDIENEYKTHRLEEENREIKSYIDELRKENEKTREELKKLMEEVKKKKSETK
ncbi:YadA-like family protein [Pseudostreptobacillus hongkongensis]|uniref:YadA-like family protein n=1 Tax=Pseudostreptobacillus hongkongensis TaxID=1162717 RepID=UPI000834B6A5|nr:YadA-like family protein [Pseudostreptobacillus hongkongensis]